MAAPDPIPPDLFLTAFPDPIQDVAERLRAIVNQAVPEATERVRTGWRIIGYDLPVRRKTRYFAFVAPEPKHVHLGWTAGILMTDPHGILRGAHLDLRKVRYITYEPGDPIPVETLIGYTREAAALTGLR